MWYDTTRRMKLIKHICSINLILHSSLQEHLFYFFFQIFSKDDGTFMSFEKQKGVVVNVKFDHYRYSMHGTMISLINVMKASTLLYMK